MFILYATRDGQDAFLQRSPNVETLKGASRNLINKWLRETECQFPPQGTKLVIASAAGREERPLYQARLDSNKQAWKPYLTPEQEAAAATKTHEISVKRKAGRILREQRYEDARRSIEDKAYNNG